MRVESRMDQIMKFYKIKGDCSYMIPLVPPMTFLIEAPISFTVSAGSFSG